MVVQIDESSDEIYFPDPHLGDPDGCFAIGGDLNIDRLLLAYSNGIFPWYSFRDQKDEDAARHRDVSTRKVLG